VHTVPLAVPEAAVRNSVSPSQIPTILYVGQLIRGKGVDQLLQALVKIQTPYRAVIVGKGNAEDSLRKLSKQLGIEQCVEFVGWVANEHLPQYYSRAHVLAVPSRWPEPFGMVGLEAMRYGKPVVAFDVGGIPDWLQHQKTGLLAPAGDVSSFAACLEHLLADKALAASYGAAASAELELNFSFASYIHRLQQLLLPSHCGEVSSSKNRYTS